MLGYLKHRGIFFELSNIIKEMSSTKKPLLRKIYRSIYLANCFYQMVAVIVMQKPTDIVALNFLPRTFRSYKAKVLSLYFLKL